MKVAIIHARGNSKRIPKKNIKEFNGKPILAYPIETAEKSKLFDRIIVSTDSEEIALIAQECGAEVPYLRPAALADDHTPTQEVLLHDIIQLSKECDIHYACCIYGTSVFCQQKQLHLGLETLKRHQCSTAFSVTSFPCPIYRGLKINESGVLSMLYPEHRLTRSQDLPETYHDAAQFYWVDAMKYLKTPVLYSSDAMPVLIPRHLVQDIDTNEDWKRAEYMYQSLKKGGEL